LIVPIGHRLLILTRCSAEQGSKIGATAAASTTFAACTAC
jgi:hypothetical protein